MEHLYNYINIVSFTICYLLAFLLELFRWRWRSPILRPVILLITLAGLILNSIYISYNYLFRNDHLITSMGGWFFVLVLILGCVYLYTLLIKRKSYFGIFFFPMIFILTAIAASVRSINFPEHETGACIRGFHGVFLLLSALFMVSGFLFGLLYLIQKRRLRKKASLSGAIPLPSLETLEKLNLRALRISTVSLGFGIISGFYIQWILTSQAIVKSGLLDPMILGTLILFLLMTIFLHLISRTSLFKGGDAPALTAIGSFVFFFAFLLLGVFFSGRHWQEIAPLNDKAPGSTAPKSPGRDSSDPPILIPDPKNAPDSKNGSDSKSALKNDKQSASLPIREGAAQ